MLDTYMRHHLDEMKGIPLSVYMALALHAKRDRTCFPSLRRLAQVSGHNETRTSRAIHHLEERGWIAVKREKKAARRASVNHYTLLAFLHARQEQIPESGETPFVMLDTQLRPWLCFLRGAPLAVFMELALRIDHKRQCNPGLAVICRDTGYSRSAAIRAIKLLEEMELVAVDRDAQFSGYYGDLAANVYSVLRYAQYGRRDDRHSLYGLTDGVPTRDE